MLSIQSLYVFTMMTTDEIKKFCNENCKFATHWNNKQNIPTFGIVASFSESNFN